MCTHPGITLRDLQPISMQYNLIQLIGFTNNYATVQSELKHITIYTSGVQYMIPESRLYLTVTGCPGRHSVTDVPSSSQTEVPDAETF